MPRDVQVAGRFALFAEQLFANAVAPIVDVGDPAQPFFRGVLDFGLDYAGTGIAVSGPHVYWTGQSFVVSAENGTTGTTRLFIGQYIAIEDRAGLAPTITLTQPLAGTSAVEGSQLTARADARDDVAVASVTFTVNGAAAFTDTSEPFEARLTVPPVPGPMVIGAQAADYGGNTRDRRHPWRCRSIPDPLTTVTGRVVDGDGNPISGATVTVLTLETTSTADGTFTIANVPTVQGSIVARATAVVNGRTARGGSTPVAAGARRHDRCRPGPAARRPRAVRLRGLDGGDGAGQHRGHRASSRPRTSTCSTREARRRPPSSWRSTPPCSSGATTPT